MFVTLNGYLPQPVPGPAPDAPIFASVVLAREIDPSDLRQAVRSGDLVRVRRGAYHSRVKPTAPDPMDAARRRIVAVSRQLTTPFWFSHESAALVWGLWLVVPPAQTHLIQTVNPNRRTDRQVRRHCSELPAHDRHEHGGLPVTSLLRTAVDCAMSLSGPRGLALVDSALRIGALQAGVVPGVSAAARRAAARRAATGHAVDAA